MLKRFAGKRFGAPVGFLLILFVPGYLDAQTPSITTGIEGVVSISPIHGGPSRLGEVDSAPLANAVFEVANAAGVATTFTTDDAGHFRVPLPPGRYTIKKGDAKKFPRCGPFEAEVTAAGFNKVTWECDSGMR
jgi:hypothetical protein